MISSKQYLGHEYLSPETFRIIKRVAQCQEGKVQSECVECQDEKPVGQHSQFSRVFSRDSNQNTPTPLGPYQKLKLRIQLLASFSQLLLCAKNSAGIT